MIPPRIKNVTIIKNYILEITYVNGEVKIYDMEKNLRYDCYKNLKNPKYFKKLKNVETTIEWPEGEDIDPNDLYENSIIK